MKLGPLLLVALALVGCGEKAPAYGSYTLTVTPPGDSGAEGEAITLEQEFGADCGVNTSYPDSDPRSGTFYVSVLGEGAATLSLLVHWLELDSAPAAGDYPIDGTMDLAVSVNQEAFDPGSGSVAVSNEGEGLRMDFSGFDALSGTLLCLED